ncbi:MAG: OmpH family outer membrane protein [Acidobacteriota bacterium]
MRVLRFALLALLAGILAGAAYGQTGPYGGPPGPQGQYNPNTGQPDSGYYGDQDPTVDVGFFYSELSPYGEWVRHPQYGWVWFPRHVNAGWRPYSLGRWVESEYGWTWVSNEPFGWATYHYGRWAWDPRFGWLWVPGTDWGPAWVAWQQGNGYVGWAPLPPTVGFQVGVGIQLGGLNISLLIAPRDYSFVPERQFLDPNIGGYIVPQARNITIIHNTTNITNYTVINNRVINHGVPLDRIEKATGRKAQVLRVADVPNPRGAGMQRNVVNIYRPPESKLETVKVARRNNAGLPQAEPTPNRPEAQLPTEKPHAVTPGRQEPAAVSIPVAPRVKSAPATVDERQFQREQKDLKAKMDKEQQALDQIHRQEMKQAKAKADAQAVEQRHAAEVQALQEQRQHSEQQLQTRQQIERQAAQASAAKAHASPKPPADQGKKAKTEKKSDTQTQTPPSR